MCKYTPAGITRWIQLGPRAWLVLMLLVGLIGGLGGLAHGRADQDAAWVWPAEADLGGVGLCPSRIGRRVWRLCRVVRASGMRLVCRMGLLASLLAASGLTLPPGCAGVWHWVWLPLVEWGLNVVGVMWPKTLLTPVYRCLVDSVRRAYQWSVVGLSVVVAQRWLALGPTGVALSSMVVCERDGSRVELEAVAGSAGSTTYRVRLTGAFAYEVTPRDEFEKRLLILDVRRWRTPQRVSRTWGLVKQEALAAVFGVTQEEISRWEKYRRAGQWAQLLSRSDTGVLTDDRRQQIVEVWAANIWQSAQEVRARLTERGVAVAQRVVEEAGRHSGLMHIRSHLKAQWVNGAEGPRPRETYLVEQLFRLVDQMQTQREQAQASPTEVGVDVVALRQLAGMPEPEKCLEKPWPWLFQVEHWLFGAWQPVEEGRIHCIYCGSDHVAIKSQTPRLKAYLDEHGQRHTVEVYRYYCKNPDCPYQTFTPLPPGLIVHSVWTLDARLKALELYAGLHTTYRGAAAALGVAPATLYHWLAQFGAEALPVAALFGVVRSSGVVGIDEKYVQVPKNDKPAGKQRKWMYVYVAIDMHTLDLLHINIFPHLGKDSARTFLLELRAKGYHPRVIVTDMNQDYAEPLTAVFPKATHHECVFHALQYWHRCFKEAFGRDYAQTDPGLFKLRQDIDHIFQAQTRRTVEKRYTDLMAQRDTLVQSEPRLAPILDSLTRHYPYLVNAYDHPLIPLTNNATERLIRRFEQHYQNFAGFDSLPTARGYLHLFELTYRFTPFGREVQPHLRGKCPLELAGYDLTQVPLARYLREHGTAPLIPTRSEVVPE